MADEHDSERDYNEPQVDHLADDDQPPHEPQDEPGGQAEPSGDEFAGWSDPDHPDSYGSADESVFDERAAHFGPDDGSDAAHTSSDFDDLSSSLVAEPTWWAQPVDADLEPEHAQFADPFPEDSPLPAPADGLAWSDADSLTASGLSMLGIVPIEPLSVLLDEDQQHAPTPAEQAVMDWVSAF